MSNTNLYSINHISKLLTRYKDNVTDEGGAIAYSFFIYDSQVDDVIKKYAMQYIYYIYILIFDEIIGKIAFPFEEDKNNTIILYDTNFLSLEEQIFIDTFLSILNINETVNEINPENNYIKYIYKNCFTLIQEYLHYEYNVTLSSMTNTAPNNRMLTRVMKIESIANLQLILKYMLIELLEKKSPARNITIIYKELICLAITLCNIILVEKKIISEHNPFWTMLYKDITVTDYIEKNILPKLTSLEKCEELLIQIQHIMNSCLQSINIVGNDSRVLSIKTIINALATIQTYFITLFNIGTGDKAKRTLFMNSFNKFTKALTTIIEGNSATLAADYNYKTIFLLCRMDIKDIKDEDKTDIQQLINSKTLYINFIDEIIAQISLLTTKSYIDVTYIKDKLKHIILTNKIFRDKKKISNKIEIFTNECKENINNFQLNYLSIATKFNSISNYNRNLLLQPKPHMADDPGTITNTLVYGTPILYSLSAEFAPKITNTINTCGINENPTLTYINPSYENLFCPRPP